MPDRPIFGSLPPLTYDELTVLLIGLNRVELEYEAVADVAQSIEIRSLVAEVRAIRRSLTTAVTEARFNVERPVGGPLEALRVAWARRARRRPLATKTSEQPFEIIAANEQEHARFELRRFVDRWQACYLRRSDDGWHVRNEITVVDG